MIKLPNFKLSRYLLSSHKVQALNAKFVDVNIGLEIALRLGVLKIMTNLVGQVIQLKKAITAKD